VEAEWPPRWELTAPESHVIAYRGGSFGPEAVRLAVVELVSRRVLRLEAVERTRALRESRREWGLAGGPAAGSPIEPPLDVVLEAFRCARRRHGLDAVLVRDYRRALHRRLGAPERSSALTREAGSALLLTDDHYPELADLNSPPPVPGPVGLGG
jgi:hypothetical protein